MSDGAAAISLYPGMRPGAARGDGLEPSAGELVCHIITMTCLFVAGLSVVAIIIAMVVLASAD